MLEIFDNRIYLNQKFIGYLYLHKKMWILEMEQIEINNKYLIENESRDILIDILFWNLIEQELIH